MRSGILHCALPTTISQTVFRDGVEQLQVIYSLLLLKWQHCCAGDWRLQTCNVLATTTEANVQIFRYGWLRNSLIFLEYVHRLSPVPIASYRYSPSRNSSSFVRSKFPPTLPWFSYPRCMLLMLTVSAAGTAVGFRWKFYFVHKDLNNYTVLDVLWQGWKRVIHCEPNTTQISFFAAAYSTENRSWRKNKNVAISSVSGSHRKHESSWQSCFFLNDPRLNDDLISVNFAECGDLEIRKDQENLS
jgi:hypothetical protein